MMTYLKNCSEFDNSSIAVLEKTIEDAEEVSYEEFFRGIGGIEAIKYWPYYHVYEWRPGVEGLRLEDDYHVSFYRSTYRGEPAYYICHSGMEWIFV